VDDNHDAAMVIYRYLPDSKRVDLIIGGFSGRATWCLGGRLGTLAKKFWPPPYVGKEMQLGAFVVRFDFLASRKEGRAGAGKDPAAALSKTSVIPLHASVLKRRIK
jgi:hypothetical protein